MNEVSKILLWKQLVLILCAFEEHFIYLQEQIKFSYL